MLNHLCMHELPLALTKNCTQLVQVAEFKICPIPLDEPHDRYERHMCVIPNTHHARQQTFKSNLHEKQVSVSKSEIANKIGACITSP